MPDVVHIDCPQDSPGDFEIRPGEKVGDVLQRLGASVRVEHKPYPTSEERERAELEARVLKLRREYDRWEDVPSPIHGPDDPCTECEALRIVAGQLERSEQLDELKEVLPKPHADFR